MAEVLSEHQYDEWDVFVSSAKGGTIFHTSWYLLLLNPNIEIRVLRDKEGRIEAGMVITSMRFLGTKAVRRPVWVPYNGPLVRESRKASEVERVSDEKKLMLRLLGESPRRGLYDYTLPPEYVDIMPFLWNGFDVSVEYTYQIPPQPVETWRQAMTSSHRRDLRKAEAVAKEIGAAVEWTDNFEECQALIQQTAEIKGFRHRSVLDVLQNWWRVVTTRDAGQLYVVRESTGQAICATLLVFDHRCAYYCASGIRKDARRGKLNLLSRLLVDRMIQDVHSRKLVFDFEGSVLPGVEPFFRGWGGRCVPKYRAVKIPRFRAYWMWSLHRFWACHRKREWFSVL